MRIIIASTSPQGECPAPATLQKECPADEKRLVAEMLCLEHAARVVGPDLAPLKEPHEPWPTVALGGGRVLHYRPAAGVVYYTAGVEPTALLSRVRALLETAGDTHLTRPRAVGSTTLTVTRAPNPDVPTRDFRLVGTRGVTDPISQTAVFTWQFVPAVAALLAEPELTLERVNASVAGILYDTSRRCRRPDGTDIDFLRPGDFALTPLLPALAPLLGSGQFFAAEGQREYGALVVDLAAGSIIYASDAGRVRECRALSTLPREWETPPSSDIAAWRCAYCRVPLANTAARVRTSLLCRFCFTAIEPPISGEAVPVPHTQAAIFRAVGQPALATLLEGRVRSLPGLPQAIVVDLAAGNAVVIAGDSLGSYPEITADGVCASNLPVLSRVRLITH